MRNRLFAGCALAVPGQLLKVKKHKGEVVGGRWEGRDREERRKDVYYFLKQMLCHI